MDTKNVSNAESCIEVDGNKTAEEIIKLAEELDEKERLTRFEKYIEYRELRNLYDCLEIAQLRMKLIEWRKENERISND